MIRPPTPITITALANGASTEIYAVGGDRLFVFESDQADFEVSIDGGPFVPIGLGVNPRADAEFKRVKFKNTSGGTLNAVVIASFWNYDDTRAHFVGGALNVVVTNTTAQPVPVALTTSQLAGLTQTQLAGVYGRVGVAEAATKIWTGTGETGSVNIQVQGRDALGAVWLGWDNALTSSNFGHLLSPALSEYQPGGAITLPAASDIWARASLTQTFVSLMGTQV